MHVNEQSPPSLPILSKLGGSKKPILKLSQKLSKMIESNFKTLINQLKVFQPQDMNIMQTCT